MIIKQKLLFTLILFSILFIEFSIKVQAQIIKNTDFSELKYSHQQSFAFKNNLTLKDELFIKKISGSNFSPAPPDLYLFSGFGNNIIKSFKGKNLYLQLGAVASTAIIIETNTDYHVSKFFYENPRLGNLASPVIRIGTFLPFIIGGSLYAYGKLEPDDRAVGASFAVLQSSLIAFLYNSLLKAATGRPHPNWTKPDEMKELSRTFRFGFLRGGIFWGWPSGHTSTAVAVVSALTSFYPEKTWLKITGYSLAAYMIYGVTSFHGGQMHWFSDAVAAAFIYYAIGSTVGKFYRDKFSEKNGGVTNLQKKEPDPWGLSFSFSF